MQEVFEIWKDIEDYDGTYVSGKDGTLWKRL